MTRSRVVLLGLMTKMPVAGVVWQNLHYLLGFERLGYEAFYVEAHGINPQNFQRDEHDLGSRRAAAFIADSLRPYGFGDRWAYHALHDDGAVYGMDAGRLRELYRSADLIINLHGGTRPLPEHAETGRLVYLETDPVRLQVELHDNRQPTVEHLEPHVAFFTFGESYGRPGCGLPVSDRFRFLPTRQPVVLECWERLGLPAGDFTTVGSYRQHGRNVSLDGEEYYWTKHREWAGVLDLPGRTGQRFQLALSRTTDNDRRRLAGHGWTVTDAGPISASPDRYRRFIADSMAEFTVAKDQNVRLRTGWFSDRSATYLAAGRPVITQDTGFDAHLPVGEGLLAWGTADEAQAAVEEVAADPVRHGRAAAEIAREHFDAERVLKQLTSEVGL
jgi:hypothetical protein